MEKKLQPRSLRSSRNDKACTNFLSSTAARPTTLWRIYARRAPALRYVSEPDEGIYDGMNKGIRLTSGKFLYFLGAGDRLLPGVLEAVAREISKLPGQSQTLRPTFLYGNVDSSHYSRPYDGRFDRFKLLRRNICHQAIFYQRSVFERLGCFNTKYRLLADWEFNIRCFNDRGIRKRYIPLRIAAYEGVVNLSQRPIWHFTQTFQSFRC